jgi:hypothetical protein
MKLKKLKTINVEPLYSLPRIIDSSIKMVSFKDNELYYILYDYNVLHTSGYHFLNCVNRSINSAIILNCEFQDTQKNSILVKLTSILRSLKIKFDY